MNKAVGFTYRILKVDRNRHYFLNTKRDLCHNFWFPEFVLMKKEEQLVFDWFKN
jgi:hypothetical protein